MNAEGRTQAAQAREDAVAMSLRVYAGTGAEAAKVMDLAYRIEEYITKDVRR